MEEKEWLEALQQLEKKLARAQKRGSVLYQKAKLLEEIADMAKRYEDDARIRESDAKVLIRQLIARQREMSVMLNRSNTLVARMYEAGKMMSLEFKEAAQALPAPKKAEIEQKISKIDELFKKTGVPEAETSEASPAESKEDQSPEHSPAGSAPDDGRGPQWSPAVERKPPLVEAEPVEEHPDGRFAARSEQVQQQLESVESHLDEIDVDADEQASDEISEDRRRKWWAKFGFGHTAE